MINTPLRFIPDARHPPKIKSMNLNAEFIKSRRRRILLEPAEPALQCALIRCEPPDQLPYVFRWTLDPPKRRLAGCHLLAQFRRELPHKFTPPELRQGLIALVSITN